MKQHLRMKYNSLDLVVVLMLFLGLGCRTNYFPNEKNLSTILIILLFGAMVLSNQGILQLKRCGSYIIWYSIFVSICCLSMIWTNYDISVYTYALVKDTYIPLIFIVLALASYECRNEEKFRLLKLLVIAENLVIIRCLIHTPWGEMLQTFDSRLFASGLGQNYNDFTTQMTLVSIVVAFLALYCEKNYRKVYVVYLTTIFLSGSRKSIIVSLVALFVLYLFSSGKNVIKIMKRLSLFAVACGLILILIFNNSTLYTLVGAKLLSALQSIGMSSLEMRTAISGDAIDHSLHGRAVLREEAWKRFLEHPICGIGYYAFMFTNSYALYAHNNWLELLADLGLLGFTAYYSLYLMKMISSIKKMNQEEEGYPISKFTLIFLGAVILMEYAQITFFRLFALIPILVVFMTQKKTIRTDKISKMEK